MESGSPLVSAEHDGGDVDPLHGRKGDLEGEVLAGPALSLDVDVRFVDSEDAPAD